MLTVFLGMNCLLEAIYVGHTRRKCCSVVAVLEQNKRFKYSECVSSVTDGL